MKYFWFTCFIIAVVLNFWWFDKWSIQRDLAYEADSALGECIDSKGYDVLVITEDNSCEIKCEDQNDCPEVETAFLDWCRSLPINQPAGDDTYIERVFIECAKPVCARYEYFFNNEYCVLWE